MNKEKFLDEKDKIAESVHQTREDVRVNIHLAKRTKLILSVLKLTVLVLIVVALPLYIYFFQHDIINQFNSFEDILAMMERYRLESIFIYIGVQVLQIIISVIPGQAFQFAAGYLYGALLGLAFSLIGAVIGTFLAFYLAKLLGKDAVHLFFGEERMAGFIEKLNSKKAYMLVFLLYLIPGLPKDIVAYAAGISEMDFKRFLIFSLIGRIPGMAGSLAVGALYFREHYVGMAIVAILAVSAFIICILKRKSIERKLDKLYERFSE